MLTLLEKSRYSLDKNSAYCSRKFCNQYLMPSKMPAESAITEVTAGPS
jgi:hypothetical protein